MRKKDLAEVLKIERKCFEEPYSREIFEQELKIKAAQLWVIPYRQKIVGYIDFWLVASEMELVSIAVHPKFKRRGIGQYLMEEMFDYGCQHQASSIVLDVRKSNLKAQKLYGKFGFKKVGLRKKYYSDNQEDAIVMKRKL